MGNPAACIFIDSNQVLSGAHMQEIAMQHKGFVSEDVVCKQEDSTVDWVYYSRFLHRSSVTWKIRLPVPETVLLHTICSNMTSGIEEIY